MSTIIATTLQTTNVSDGTDTISATYVTGGSAKVLASYATKPSLSIGATLNVSSITDAAAGEQELNLTNAFSSVDFMASGMGKLEAGFHGLVAPYGTQETSIVKTATLTGNNTAIYGGTAYSSDYILIHTAVQGDLA
jgi:hypothetical protein